RLQVLAVVRRKTSANRSASGPSAKPSTPCFHRPRVVPLPTDCPKNTGRSVHLVTIDDMLSRNVAAGLLPLVLFTVGTRFIPGSRDHGVVCARTFVVRRSGGVRGGSSSTPSGGSGHQPLRRTDPRGTRCVL